MEAAGIIKRSCLAVVGVTVIASAGYFVWLLSTARADVALDEILADDMRTAGASSWEERSAELPARSEFGTDSVAARAWSVPGGRAGEYAIRYGSPVSAEWSYIKRDPTHLLADDFPRFTSAADPFDSRHAERSKMVCALGKPPVCGAWFYWARYGQYLVRLDYFAPDKPIDEDQFKQYVAIVDAQVDKIAGR